MNPIIVDDFLDVPELQKINEYKSVSDAQRELIKPDMEVRLRRGEYIRVKIEEVNDQILIGKVLTEGLYLEHPFKYLDWIQFYKKNVIDIYDIDRWGVLY